MKQLTIKLFYLVLFLATLYAHFASAQLLDATFKSQTVDGKTITTVDSIKNIWNKRVDLTPTHGQTYDWRLGADSANYFHPTPGKNMRARVTFYDAAIGLPTTEPPPPVITTTRINDRDLTKVTYSGSWTPASGASWTQKFHNNDVTYSVTPGGVATLNFTGTKVEIVAEKCDNHGVARVQILKGATVVQTQDVDMYKNTGGTASSPCPNGEVASIFTSNDLPQDSYSVRVTFLSTDLTKVPRRDSMVFDGFVIYSK